MAYCPKCAAIVEAQAASCHRCGAIFGANSGLLPAATPRRVWLKGDPPYVAAGMVVAGIVLAFLVGILGAQYFVGGRKDWDAFAHSIIWFLVSTVGLGAMLMLAGLAVRPWRSRLVLAGLGSAISLWTLPVIGGFVALLFNVVFGLGHKPQVVESEFRRICRDARITLGKRGERASGVLFTGSAVGDISPYKMLVRTPLEYVEVPAAGAFERIEVVGKKQWDQTKFNRVTVKEAQALLELVVADAKWLGDRKTIREERMELRRRKDNAVVASMAVYYDKELRQYCPAEAQVDPNYAFTFVKRGIELGQ